MGATRCGNRGMLWALSHKCFSTRVQDGHRSRGYRTTPFRHTILSMHFRRALLRLALAFACLTLTLSLALAQTAKRPINHHDYDTWRTIAGQRITNDGKFLAYSLFPEEGDGEVVIRNLVTGQETRIPAGARPVAAPAATDEEEGPPVQRGVTIEFSADSKTVVFSTFPSKAETNQARKDKKTTDQMPKDGM